MDKDSVKELINDSIITEELAIPIYEQHLESSLFWSPFSGEEKDYILASLKKLIIESRGHIKILLQLTKILKEL